MVDVIKAAFQIGIQDILGLVINDRPDRRDGILTGASWAKAIAIWLEFAFPGWFERELHESLLRSCFHHGYTKRALFELAWFGDIDPSYRLDFQLLPVLWVDVFSHCKTLRWFNGFYSIDSCGFLALVVLGHSTHCKQPCCPGLHQQFLKLLNCSLVATLFGSKDALLYPVHVLLQLAPGQLAPPLTLRVKGRFLFGPGCLRFCDTTCASFFHSTVLTSAYPGHYPRYSLLEQSFSQGHWLAPTCRIDHRQELS